MKLIGKTINHYASSWSSKSQPFLWVLREHPHDYLPADAPVHHLGHNVLQNVGVPMTSVAGLQARHTERKRQRERESLGGQK